MSFSSILQVVKIENEKGVSQRTKRPYDFIIAQCLLLNESGGVEQTGRMMVPDSLRKSIALDVYQAGFSLTVAGMGKRKGEIVPRLMSLTSLNSGEVSVSSIPSCQHLQVLKVNDLQSGISQKGSPWTRQTCEVMLLDSVDGKFVPSDVGRLIVPESMREGLSVGAYSGTFALHVSTYGDEKDVHEVSARLTSLKRVGGGFKVGLPKQLASALSPVKPSPVAEPVRP